MTTLTLNHDPQVLIDWFDNFHGPNEYGFLSNFHEGHPIMWRGIIFPTSEHAFAFEKPVRDTDGDTWRLEIAMARDPGTAKFLGRSCPLRHDWEQVKFKTMHEIVFTKFRQHRDLTNMLLDTGDAYLQEGTFWGDEIWGVDASLDLPPFERPGLNWLGMILMDVRTRLRIERRMS